MSEALELIGELLQSFRRIVVVQEFIQLLLLISDQIMKIEW